MLHRPREVATRLGVSAPTLRLWSSYYAGELSAPARKESSAGGVMAQRRYTEEDVATLQEVRAFLRSGLTFEETMHRLLASRELAAKVASEAGSPAQNDTGPSAAVLQEQLQAKDRTIAALEEALGAREAAFQALQETLAVKDKTIDALKDSLQFFNAYLRALGGMRSERQQSPLGSGSAWTGAEELESQEDDQSAEEGSPLWKRLLGIR